MPRKEFVHLMEENVMILDRLGQRLRLDPVKTSGYPRQQMTALVRLRFGGTARLKDIADREQTTTPNLCATFRRLEREGLVARTIDDTDRRNTYYSITPAGEQLADVAIKNFRAAIEKMFSSLSATEEKTMTDALRTINKVLNNMEKGNA